jgi:tetratricopeptide (TPR) repeat protein
VTLFVRGLAAFAVVQSLLLVSPKVVSAPTTGTTAESCMACAESCDLTACHRIAVELATARNYAQAIQIEEMVFARDTANPEVAAALAKMYEAGRKDIVNALRLYHEALGAAPGYPPALLGLGMMMKDRGQLAVAEAYFERGARENPAQPLFKVRLAEVLIETGRADRAKPLLEQIVAEYPESGEADSARRLMGRTVIASP